ncbi:hypothetical protein Sste5344_009670 [Sporothrix stenoceras]
MFLFWGLFAHIKGLYGSWRDWLFGDGAAQPADVYERIRQCRGVVDFSFANGDATSKGIDLCSRLALRAKANQHLADALGILNSLTTDDPATQKTFLRQATQRLKKMALPEHWQQLYRHCESVFEKGIVDYQDNNHLPLAALVRGLCLQSVMHILFQVSHHDKEDIDIVCSEINKQWMLSKEAQGPRSTVQQSGPLNDAQARLLQYGVEPDMPPQEALGLILPSYEALWRVVLLTYVTVCHRSDGAVHARLEKVDVLSVLGTGNAEEKELLQVAKAWPEGASIVFNNTDLDGIMDAELPTGRCDMEDWELVMKEGG